LNVFLLLIRFDKKNKNKKEIFDVVVCVALGLNMYFMIFPSCPACH